jgi:tetratricopeptide (TPR) repeat protein
MATTVSTPSDNPATPKPTRYVRTVGPRLRLLLLAIFALVAVLGANSIYLGGVTASEWFTGRTYQNYFYLMMFLVHVVLGLLLVVPFVAFGFIHMLAARNRRNRRAVRMGYALFAAGIAVLATGLLLVRIEGVIDLKQPIARDLVYWLHVATPLAALWLYWLHRLAGPRIKWRLGAAYLGVVGATVAVMLALQMQDPRNWNVAGPASGTKYFEPSLARTATGNFIPAETLMMDQYCLECHQDAYKGWFHSAHHLSSFNNPAYLASVRETRTVSFERDGNVQASRWCAGCHDPVPFFSGAFDDPKFDLVNHPTAQAGITCTACHAITDVHSTKGNADFTIEEPLHYPFATSENSFLRYVNRQLVKAKPSFHKKTFLKPHHKEAEFCSTCHKVHLPYALNHYKEFLRGQNHYDPYLLSGVSGHGARSFYYPPKATHNCAGCHMPLEESGDFGAKLFADAKELSIHDHLFPAANTGLAWMKDQPEVIKRHQEFLKDIVRVDIFGLKEGGQVDSPLIAPLRPTVPALKPGTEYLLESVIRTLKMGHAFTQGTVDSNEVWLDVTVASGDRVVGRNGAIANDGTVDPWSHFINVFMLDRNGNHINRRNPQDIFVPLYNHQIPPGAGQVAHYGFRVPDDAMAPITITVKLQYRKFDQEYMKFVAEAAKPGDIPLRGNTPGEPYHNALPITTLATDTITLAIDGGEPAPTNPDSTIPPWQRWNDYGIGLLLEGRAELRQAAAAFAEVEKLGRYDGPLNLARVYLEEGRLDDATAAIARAAAHKDPPAPPWTMAWLSGRINQQQGHLEAAEKNFRSVLEDRTPEMIERGFDFSKDYEVINLLGQVQFDRAKQVRDPAKRAERDALLNQAVATFNKTLELDGEDVAAHHNLSQIHRLLGNESDANHHHEAHARFKPDDNARDFAVSEARKKYPAANHAAEAFVIYPLQRDGAPGLSPPTPSTNETASVGGGQ